jgi:poly-gamma-glutamate synthesis protein (capsule biosynthesis protein)
MAYVGFDGAAHRGEMVVHRRQVRPVTSVFARLYRAGFPIRRMRLVDEYDGSDRLSMAGDNTSGFSCRPVAGTRTWSGHAYGEAIDINPVENPDLTGGSPAPAAGRRFAQVDRDGRVSRVPGLITSDGVAVRAFASVGWEWGGGWSAPDYQHFRAGGG